MRIEPLVVLLVAALVALWPFVLSQSADSRGWVRYQAMGVGALLVAAVVGVILELGPARFAWLVLAVAMVVRLALIPRQARKWAAQPQGASGTSE